MAKYTGKSAIVDMPATEFAAKFDDLRQWEEHTHKMTDQMKKEVGELHFEQDAIVLRNPAIGEMKFVAVERNDRHIVFKGEGMIPIEISLNLEGVDNGAKTQVVTVLDVDIPMMLRPLVGGKLQQVADTFGTMIAGLASGKPLS